MNTQLVNLAIQETPAVVAMIRGLFVKQNPTVPPPTDDEVIAAFQSAFASSLAKDEAWLVAHPA